MFVETKRISYFGNFPGDREVTNDAGKQAPNPAEVAAADQVTKGSQADVDIEQEGREIGKSIIDEVIDTVQEEERAASVLQMQEMRTEIQRVGRLIKVEEMKKVWKKYSEILEKKEETIRQRITRGIINDMISLIIVQEERDEEIMLESEINREKREKLEKAEIRRNEFWLNRMEVDPEVDMKRIRRQKIVADSALKKRKRNGRTKYSLVSELKNCEDYKEYEEKLGDEIPMEEEREQEVEETEKMDLLEEENDEEKDKIKTKKNWEDLWGEARKRTSSLTKPPKNPPGRRKITKPRRKKTVQKKIEKNTRKKEAEKGQISVKEYIRRIEEETRPKKLNPAARMEADGLGEMAGMGRDGEGGGVDGAWTSKAVQKPNVKMKIDRKFPTTNGYRGLNPELGRPVGGKILL